MIIKTAVQNSRFLNHEEKEHENEKRFHPD